MFMTPAEKIYQVFAAIAIAIVCMVVLFQIAESLLDMVPLWIKVVISSLVALFVYSSRDYIKKVIKDLFR